MDDDEFQISYMGVTIGVPVLTRDGEQFGILEHVLAVEEEDIFEGIVVWIGGGGWAGRKIQRELSMGHQSAAHFLEKFRHNDLRFVEADKIAMITAGYIRCAGLLRQRHRPGRAGPAAVREPVREPDVRGHVRPGPLAPGVA
jgi:hypothetical protein